MSGLVYLKNMAATYIVVLFVTTLVGQPVLNGVLLSNQNSSAIVNTITEEENNEEVGDEETPEISIDYQLHSCENIAFGVVATSSISTKIAQKYSIVLKKYIPPPRSMYY